MTKDFIAQAFSMGKFDEVLEFIAEDAVWEVVEEGFFEGKDAIVANCNQVAAYFNAVQTEFNLLHTVSQDNKVVVNGTAGFYREGKPVSFVSACDLYEFNDQDKLQRITSYCIQREKN